MSVNIPLGNSEAFIFLKKAFKYHKRCVCQHEASLFPDLLPFVCFILLYKHNTSCFGFKIKALARSVDRIPSCFFYCDHVCTCLRNNNTPDPDLQAVK